MALVSRGEIETQLFGNARHDLALRDAVRHQLLGQHVLAGLHRINRGGGMQEQRQRDDDGFDIRVGKQVVIVLVNFDVLSRFVFRAPAVLGHQASANAVRVIRVGTAPVAVQAAMDVVRANIGDRDDLDVVRIQRADQHTAFITRSNDADPDRVIHLVAVAKIRGTESAHRDRTGCDHAFQHIAARNADRFVVIRFADCLFFGGHAFHD